MTFNQWVWEDFIEVKVVSLELQNTAPFGFILSVVFVWFWHMNGVLVSEIVVKSLKLTNMSIILEWGTCDSVLFKFVFHY